MNKKILIGSMLVLTLLLLMPTIPAIQHNIVKDTILSDLPEDLDLKDIMELIESGRLNRLKHPLLFTLIFITMLFRHTRIIFLDKFTKEQNPLLYERSIILYITTVWWFVFWHFLGINFHWNWRDYYPNFIWEYFPW